MSPDAILPAQPGPGVGATADAAGPVAANDAADAAFRAKATGAAEKFESFFIAQMLKQMRAATRELAAEGSVFKDSVNADMLSLADGLVADKMSGQHAFGIADAILRQLLPAAPAVAPAAAPAPAPAPAGPPLNAGPPAVASDG